MLKIIEKTKLWFAISIIVILIGIINCAARGLNFGIDFTGGSVITVKIDAKYNIEDVRNIAVKYDSGAIVQAVEGNEITIRGNSFTDVQISQMVSELKDKYQLKDNPLLSSDRIGPSIGNELRKSAIISMLVAAALMLVYITIRFEFKSGLSAIAALIHDVLITISVYAILQIPLNSSFIAAILTILGYSINDTIVVFDRIRENKKLGRYKDYTTLANASITQTMSRSINTVLTTLFTITAIYILGVPAIKEFALPIIIGILSGTYSSIFIASPLWVLLKKNEKYA